MGRRLHRPKVIKGDQLNQSYAYCGVIYLLRFGLGPVSQKPGCIWHPCGFTVG